MSSTATLVETRLTIDGTEWEIGRILRLLDARINAHGRYLFGVPLTSAGYEVLTSETTGQRDGSTVGEASLRLFGTQPEVESLVRVISQHASHRN